MNKSRIVSLSLAIVAGVLFIMSLQFPMWRMRMEGPQYRGEEAIKVSIYPGAMRGDLKEIQTLDQYIGVRIPSELPQVKWIPLALIAAGALGLLASVLPIAFRARVLSLIPIALSLALLGAALQAKNQMYDIGHHRNEKAPLRGVKDFTPPFLGKAKLFQFEVSSWFGPAAYLIAAGIALQGGAAWASRRPKRFCINCRSYVLNPCIPEKLAY